MLPSWVSTQLPLQSVRPEAHIEMHVRAGPHKRVVPEHVWPQAPQFVGVVRSVSQPSDASPLQSPQPAMQLRMQVPVMHDAVSCSRARHATPHAPQCASLVSEDSQPSGSSVTQLPKPALHAPSVQRPATQDDAAFVLVQVTPHAPQFKGSLAVAVHTPLHRIPPSQVGVPASASIIMVPSVTEPSLRSSACGSAHAAVAPTTAISARSARGPRTLSIKPLLRRPV